MSWRLTSTLERRHLLQAENVWDQPPNDSILELHVNSLRV